MALENPVFKSKKSAYNLEVNLPKVRDIPKVPTQSAGLAQMQPNTVTQGINVPKLDVDVDKATENIDGKFAKGAAKGGLAALGEAPNVINNLMTDPRTEKDAIAKNLSLASSGAQIGLAAGGPLGAGIGAAIGYGVGAWDSAGWQQDLVKENDTKAIAKNEDRNAEIDQNYWLNKTAEQIKTERSLFAEAQGLIK